MVNSHNIQVKIIIFILYLLKQKYIKVWPITVFVNNVLNHTLILIIYPLITIGSAFIVYSIPLADT